MKNLKTTILSAFIALCCLTNVNAQSAARSSMSVSVGKQTPSILSIGGGTSMPSSDGKDKAFLSNTTTLNADLFLPLFECCHHMEGGKEGLATISFGLNIGGSYSFGGSGGFGTTPNPFAVTGQTSSMVSDRGVDPKSPGFRMGVGPQANFYFGKFIVSPMVLGEYFSMTQKEMSIVQTTQFNGQSYDFNLATLPETKTNGFAVTPKLRLHYMFNDRFGLFADASYTMGPKIETTVSKLIPNGNPNPAVGDTYNLQQLQTGSMVKGETKSTAYNSMGFNFGLVIGLGRNGSKGWNGKNDATSIPINNSTMPNRRVAGDIKKGWDGTVKGLFVGNNTNLLVAKNGGAEKFIEQINKGGKGKASIYKVENREFLQISSKEETNYYEIDNNGNSTFKFINVGGVTCKVATCPNGTNCELTFFGGRERCACNNGTSTTGNGCSDASIAHTLNDYIPQLDASAIPISIEENGTTLSSSSVKNIRDLLIKHFKTATIDKVELIKEGNDLFVVSTIVNEKDKSLIFNEVKLDNKKRFVVLRDKSILMSCGGVCGSGECRSVSPVVNMGGSISCPCGIPPRNCNPQFGILIGWQEQ